MRLGLHVCAVNATQIHALNAKGDTAQNIPNG